MQLSCDNLSTKFENNHEWIIGWLLFISTLIALGNSLSFQKKLRDFFSKAPVNNLDIETD